jgi:hypothetical protein
MPIQSANPPELITLWEWTGTSAGVGGVNQSANRNVIDDQELWWLENLLPIAPGELRSAWGPSAPIYTAPGGVTILRIFFTIIDGVNPLGFMFKSDGTVDQVNLNTGAVFNLGQIWQPIAPNYWCDLKLWAPNQFGAGPGQTGGILIGSPQGLYAWDGAILTSPGQNAPDWLTQNNVTGGTTVMPSGLPGIYALEVYLGRLFVMGQTVISMSAPENGADFAAADGGGSWGYQGDQLTSSYTDIVQSAGVLYVFGDSMTNYVYSLQLVGATTAIGTLYTTQFNFSNINPQMGHRYFRPVGHWLQDLIVFDGAGLFDLSGQSMVWISAKLTNLVLTVKDAGFQPTLTSAHIFGQRWLLVNGQFTDPWGVSRSMILAWNGMIWTILSQGLNLTNIGSYEQNSVITPYGTDGTNLYKLFAQPDPQLLKRLSTKAYKGQYILTVKDWKRLYVEMSDKMNPPGPEGVSFTGTFTTLGGGIPNGAQDVGFDIPPGGKDTVPAPLEGKGIAGWLDLQSISPDFTIERVSLTYEDRMLFGA